MPSKFPTANADRVIQGWKHNDKRYEELTGKSADSNDVWCVACESRPIGVCESCVEFVCKEHLYRHPNCEEGR